MGTDGNLRARILDAALEILQDSGIKNLTQPKVAASAGIRQSHLTYYFPKKIDLVIALLQSHLDHAAAGPEGSGHRNGHGEEIGPALQMIVSDRRRIRFFMGLVIEAEQEPALRRMVYDHMAQFDRMVAAYFGRAEGDEDVEAFLNVLRGFGMKQLLRARPEKIDIAVLAKRFGLLAPPAKPALKVAGRRR